MRTDSHGRTGVALALVLIAFALAGDRPSAAQVTGSSDRSFDIEGNWIADESRPLQCIRSGNGANCILINDVYAHSFVLHYVTPSTLEGRAYRRNRLDGCVTYLALNLAFRTRDSFSVTWRALDSRCDLRAGQSATDPEYARIDRSPGSLRRSTQQF